MQPSLTSKLRRTTTLVSIAAIALLVAAGCGDDPGTDQNDDSDGLDDPDVTFEIDAEGREFIVDGEENPDLNVDEGDLVEVELCVTGGTHDWLVDESDGAATDVLTVDDECDTIQFSADQTGTFDYYCGVGTHREEGMEGTLVVGDPDDNGDDNGDDDNGDDDNGDDDNGDDDNGEPDVVIELEADNYFYNHPGETEENPELIVDEGDLVELELCITFGNHDWVVDELDGAATSVMNSPGECDTIQFDADEPGSYDYYCSVGNHRSQGMEGTLTVE